MGPTGDLARASENDGLHRPERDGVATLAEGGFSGERRRAAAALERWLAPTPGQMRRRREASPPKKSNELRTDVDDLARHQMEREVPGGVDRVGSTAL